MAVDKLVDSTQLDADLTNIANAIRTKGGTSSLLAFPSEFVNAISEITTGGGITWDQIASGSQPADNIVLSVASIVEKAFGMRTGGNQTFSVFGPNVTSMGIGAFQQASNLLSARFPKLQVYNAGYLFAQCTSLKLLDAGMSSRTDRLAFSGDKQLSTIIFRNTTLVTLSAVSNFNNTPFASGNAGGTIYIPKSLYDHLGDESALDYKAATNWSTVDAYGTITWAAIEGSVYEDPNGTWPDIT